jgi:hypothetical protein
VAIGTDGYLPPPELAGSSPWIGDEYGLSAVALELLFPLHATVQRSPANLLLLRRDLAARAPVPRWLWRRATRFYPAATPGGCLPTSADLDERPRECLIEFADEVRRGVLAMADPDHPERAFPTTPRGYWTNTVCVAHGTAGVLHALHVTGSEVPGELVDRLSRDATGRLTDLPPGLHIGSAGVAWVLAELGRPTEAADVLAAADRHPATPESATLGEGLAGIGMAHLAMYGHTGDTRFLDRAAAAGDAILAAEDLPALLGEDGAVGLLHGRAGVALFLYYLDRFTGDPQYVAAGRALLHQELDRAFDLPDGALSFPDDADEWRAMPYLYAGTAGVTTVISRYLAATPDERFAAALARMRRDLTKPCTVLPALYCGLAGMTFALAEHADWVGTPEHRAEALRLGTSLVKYAVPGPSGVRFIGDGSLRFSAELWSGGAGVLLALHRLVSGPADQFFTLDLVGQTTGRALADRETSLVEGR